MFDALGLEGHTRRLAPAGAADQGRRGRGGARGRLPRARRQAAEGRPRDRHRPRPRRRRVAATTAASSRARTPCSPSARSRTARTSASTTAGVEVDQGGYVPVEPQLPVERPAHLRRRRRVGEAAAVVGRRDAGPQDRRAPHGPAQPAAPPPRLRQGGVGDLHRARDRRRRAWPRPRRSPSGRKIRVTKVPFSANAKALIKGDPRLREDPLRPGDRRGARRVDRRPQRRRAHLRARGGRSPTA